MSNPIDSRPPSTEIARWADVAMYRAVPTAAEDGSEVVVPKVSVISITADPLGEIANASLMYKGLPSRSLADVTRKEREDFFADILRTMLDSPFEFVEFHFLIEGVTRAFTHQLVRQRIGAVYVQESQRFAVKENGEHEVSLPPSLMGLKDDHPMRVRWDSAVHEVSSVYLDLVNGGIPAEDARGLLPTNITTRVHYKTNLRALIQHAGMRLCTQAQFEWRMVWAEIVKGIRAYNPLEAYAESLEVHEGDPEGIALNLRRVGAGDAWQYEALADLFRPICYKTGKCEFKSDMDRHCSIRDRVNANEAVGRPSKWWGKDAHEEVDAGDGMTKDGPVFIGAIADWEWLADPASARINPASVR